MEKIEGAGFVVPVNADELMALFEYAGCNYEHELGQGLDIGTYIPNYSVEHICTPADSILGDFGIWVVPVEGEQRETLSYRICAILESASADTFWCDAFSVEFVNRQKQAPQA